MIETAVVILNYNGRDYLERFLPVLVENTAQSEIVIADNASTDDSLEFLKENYPDLKLIPLHKNFGFAGGYNEALKQVNSDYYVLLNSDVEVTTNWLSPLIDTLRQNENIAACQPKILDFNNREYFEYAGAAGGFIDKYGYPFCRGRLFDTSEKDEGQYNDSISVFWATGACMAIRSKAFHEAGGFDDDFFAHMEEIDLCWRLHRMGLDIRYCPESKVYHVGGGTLDKMNPFKTYLNFRNGLFMMYKNNTSFWNILIRMKLDGIAALRLLFTGSFRHFTAILKAHFHFYGKLSDLKAKKRNFELGKIENRNIDSIYPGSVVWKYFLKGKRKYSDLN